MNTANHISPEDLALFALQCLPEDEFRVATDHMEHCELCRSEVGRLQGDLVSYAMTAEMHTPPVAARERLLRRVAKEKKVVPVTAPPQAQAAGEPTLASRNSGLLFQTDRVEQVQVRNVMGIGGWLGWAVAAGVAAGGWLQFHQRQILQHSLTSTEAKLTQVSADGEKSQMVLDTLTKAGAFQVALRAPLDPKAPPTAKRALMAGHTAYDSDKGSLVFLASNLDPLPAYKTYELWIIPSASGAQPIPAGTFRPDANANASVIMPDIPKGVIAQTFAVTIEDEGGSKTPTMPVIMAGV